MTQPTLVQCGRSNVQLVLRSTDGTHAAHFHGGPLGDNVVNWIGRDLVSAGFFEVHLHSTNSRNWDGKYVQDTTSAGGRCWDWIPD